MISVTTVMIIEPLKIAYCPFYSVRKMITATVFICFQKRESKFDRHVFICRGFIYDKSHKAMIKCFIKISLNDASLFVIRNRLDLSQSYPFMILFVCFLLCYHLYSFLP